MEGEGLIWRRGGGSLLCVGVHFSPGQSGLAGQAEVKNVDAHNSLTASQKHHSASFQALKGFVEKRCDCGERFLLYSEVKRSLAGAFFVRVWGEGGR